VLTGAGPTALANRIRNVAVLSREHWAPQRRTLSYHSVDPEGDFYLDFTDRIPLVMTTLDRLKEHGPMGPVWLRIDEYRPAEGLPLLKALADIRTEAEFVQRQEERDRVAKAEERRREAEERQQREEERAQAEWFEEREKKVRKLARLWDEAMAPDDL